jgi:hypothetical protein
LKSLLMTLKRIDEIVKNEKWSIKKT